MSDRKFDFAGLPRELRQKILGYVLRIEIPVKLNCSLSFFVTHKRNCPMNKDVLVLNTKRNGIKGNFIECDSPLFENSKITPDTISSAGMIPDTYAFPTTRVTPPRNNSRYIAIPSSVLKILKVSKSFREDGSYVFYGQNIFNFLHGTANNMEQILRDIGQDRRHNLRNLAISFRSEYRERTWDALVDCKNLDFLYVHFEFAHMRWALTNSEGLIVNVRGDDLTQERYPTENLEQQDVKHAIGFDGL